ncbi:MAG: SpoIIE family protein phosphatase [Thermoleophilia bacterium]
MLEDGSLVRRWVSPTFTRITGYSLDDAAAVGGWGELVHPDDRAVARGRIERLLAGEPDAVEIRVVCKNGTIVWILDRGHPIRDASGRVVRILGAARDITEFRRNEATLGVLARTGELVVAQTADAALRLLPGILVPDAAELALVVHADGRAGPRATGRGADGTALERRLVDAGRPVEPLAGAIARAVEAGATRVEEIATEVTEASLVVAPLLAGATVHGVLVVGRLGRGRWAAADVAVVDELARRAAVAVERARSTALAAAARRGAERAAERARTLQAVAAALSRAVTQEQVARACLAEAILATGARAGFVTLLEDTGDMLRILSSAGYDADRVAEMRRFPLTLELPSAIAARTGRPVWALTRRAVARYPLVQEIGLAAGDVAWAALPIPSGERPIGAILLAFGHAIRLPEEDRALLLGIASLCGQALDRARLFEAEQAARDEAQQAADRLARLQRATAALGEAVHPDAVLDVVVEQALAAVGADGAFVMLRGQDDGALHLVRERGFPPGLLDPYAVAAEEADVPAADALRTGRPTYRQSARDYRRRHPTSADDFDRSGFRAQATLPLRVHGRVEGVLALLFRSSRRFVAADRALLETLTLQCSQALERATLFDAEHVARADAEAVRDELGRVQALTDVALSELSFEQLLETLLDRVGSLLDAEAAAILLPDERGDLAVRASFGLAEDALRQVRVPVGTGIAGRVAGNGVAIVIEDVLEEEVGPSVLRDAGMRAIASVPLLAAGATVGVLSIASSTPARFGEDALRLVRLAADRMALAIANARAYQQQTAIAETLQRSLLLDTLPSVPGTDLAARYLPATDDVEVGGDWYDAVARRDGRLALVIGDVVGHGIEAAATMGMLRSALRAYLLEGYGPADVLERLDRLVRAVRRGELTTCAICVLDPLDGTLELAVAGHPPPVVVQADGSAALLESGRGTPLGVPARRRQAAERLEPGATILLYTDGLIERRTRGLEDGLARLVQAATTAEPEPLVAAVLDALFPADGRRDDDVALLAARRAEVPADRVVQRIPARPEALASARRALRSLLVRAGASVEATDAVMIAAGEACANAVEHAYGPTDASFVLDARIEGGEIVVIVSDEGSWRPARGRGRGHGLGLMQGLVDDVAVLPGEDGTRVELRHRLAAAERAGPV